MTIQVSDLDVNLFAKSKHVGTNAWWREHHVMPSTNMADRRRRYSGMLPPAALEARIPPVHAQLLTQFHRFSVDRWRRRRQRPNRRPRRRFTDHAPRPHLRVRLASHLRSFSLATSFTVFRGRAPTFETRQRDRGRWYREVGESDQVPV